MSYYKPKQHVHSVYINPSIYLGPRNETFKNMIVNILKKGSTRDKIVSLLTEPNNMSIYHRVFTNSSIDKNYNYEFFEFIGDEVVNKSIVWYIPRKFEKLRGNKGANIIPRLRILLGSKEKLSKLAYDLGMWNFISATVEVRSTKMKNLLEDVFESFFGATEYILDTQIQDGTGFEICYSIISSILDETPISLRYEDIFDPKTRLLQFFEKPEHKEKYGYVKFDPKFKGKIVLYLPDKSQEILSNISFSKGDIEQQASQEAINKLQLKGVVMTPDERYIID